MPEISHRKTSNKKLLLFKSLFRGREDVYPLFWQNKTGKKGYSPVCENRFNTKLCEYRCDDCNNQKFVPLSDSVIENHFSGFHLLGIYPLLQDGTCFFIVVDFDNHENNLRKNPLQDAKDFSEVCAIQDIPVYLERSKSGEGFHAWVFFENPIPAWKARRVMFALLREAQIIDEEVELYSFDRLFPHQDMLTGKKLGNLIALPFYGKALKQGNSTFLTGKDLVPITTDADITTFLEEINENRESSI